VELKITTNINQDGWFPDRDVNPRPPYTK